MKSLILTAAALLTFASTASACEGYHNAMTALEYAIHQAAIAGGDTSPYAKLRTSTIPAGYESLESFTQDQSRRQPTTRQRIPAEQHRL